MVETQVAKVRKMDAFQSFVAIIKGYCGSVILFFPKAFGNGGWLFSCIALLISSIFTTVCALKLVRTGQKYQCFSYSLLVKKAFGKRGRYFLDFMVAIS